MDKLIISVSPHLRGKDNTTRIMLDVIIALIPALVAAGVFFGVKAIILVAVCIAACVASEFIFNLICKRPCSIADLSAVVTGLILGLNLPVTLPIWQAVLGSVVAIVIAKQLFGGLGMNFANPALVGRLFLFVTFTAEMGKYLRPTTNALLNISPGEADLVATATPLETLKAGGEMPDLLNLLIGNQGGVIGETCAIAIILGCLYLVVRRVISLRIPLSFVGTVFVLSLFVAPQSISPLTYALAQVLSGGLLFGAVFMATDYVTSPYTKSGKIIFGIGCGLITFVIRQWGESAEGVSFALILMNILTPYINNLTATKPLGGAKTK